MRKIQLIVKGDICDADYIEKRTEFGADDETTVLGIKKLARKINGLPDNFYEDRQFLTESEKEELEDLLAYIPRDEENYVHKITEVRLYEVSPLEFE